MVTYRVFVEDVGPGCFSAFGQRDIEAETPLDAIFAATGVVRTSPVGLRWIKGDQDPTHYGARLIALPHSRKDLWPHSTTGRVPKEALRFH